MLYSLRLHKLHKSEIVFINGVVKMMFSKSQIRRLYNLKKGERIYLTVTFFKPK